MGGCEWGLPVVPISCVTVLVICRPGGHGGRTRSGSSCSATATMAHHYTRGAGPAYTATTRCSSRSRCYGHGSRVRGTGTGTGIGRHNRHRHRHWCSWGWQHGWRTHRSSWHGGVVGTAGGLAARPGIALPVSALCDGALHVGNTRCRRLCSPHHDALGWRGTRWSRCSSGPGISGREVSDRTYRSPAGLRRGSWCIARRRGRQLQRCNQR